MYLKTDRFSCAILLFGFTLRLLCGHNQYNTICLYLQIHPFCDSIYVEKQGQITLLLKVRDLSLAILKEISSIASVAMPIGERWHLRRARYAPEGASKGRICIATGIHGDEVIGQLVTFGVAQRIMRQPECLLGTADIYPMLNPLGLDVSDRMTPMTNFQDMNRSFPGAVGGTALESMCHAIYTDMLGADFVVDIHASTKGKSELYEARVDSPSAATTVPMCRALAPDLIWVYANKSAFNATLTAALSAAGTPAVILEVDERRRRPQDVAERIVDSIFCKMTEMGLWTGDAAPMPAQDHVIPCVRTGDNIDRITCEHPGVYVPEDVIGKWVEAGDSLGTIIDALEGVVRETILAPHRGLVFSQRSYSAVYPGTLIARIYTPGKEESRA